ncbi:MAG: AMP-binding protein [Bilophila wadsworthia]
MGSRSVYGRVAEGLFKTTERLSVEVTDAHETIALLQYTGGTTGLSKGAMLTHANLLANLTQLMAIIQQPPEKEHVFLALLPLFHVFGLTITLLLPARMAASGPHAAVCPRRHVGGIQKYQFTAFIGAPSVYISLLQQKNLASTICTISYSVFRDQPPCLSSG